MRILADIMDHDIIGPAIKQGRQEGWKQGWKEGYKEGRQEGRDEEGLIVLRKLIARRFGFISDSESERLTRMTYEQIEMLLIRVLDVKTLAELFER